jgi:hypothetical protein
MRMSKRSQGFTPTKDMDGGFIFCSTVPTQWTVYQPHKWRCLLRALCPVRKSVTTLDYILVKDKNLALVPRQDPEINSRACLCV